MGGFIKEFIDPTEESTEKENVIASMREAGVDSSDVEWLAEIMTSGSFLPESLPAGELFDRQEVLERLAQEAGKYYSLAGKREVALCLLLTSWLALRHDHFFARKFILRSSDAVDAPWLGSFFEQSKGVDWAEGVISAVELGRDQRLQSENLRMQDEYLIGLFLYSQFLEEDIRVGIFQRMLNNVQLQHILEAAADPSNSFNSNVFREKDRLEYCLKFDLVGGLHLYLKQNLTLDDMTFGKWAVGVYRIIGRMLSPTMTAEYASGIDPTGLPDVLLMYFQEIDSRREINQAEKWIEKSHWMYAQPKHFFGTTPSIGGFLPETKAVTLLSEAQKIFANLRVLLNDHAVAEDDPRLDREYLLAVQTYLRYRGGAWITLKLMLLIFSGLSEQSVAKDLRYWYEPNRDPIPTGLGAWIVDRIAQLFHSLKEEQQEDPKLEMLRSSFADYCIGRLKPKTFKEANDSTKRVVQEEELIEPRKVWRFAYSQALTELRINPNGRGHRVLYWVSANDPDEEVRSAAKQAYTLLRHNPDWPADLSPRRALFAAFWWLRQAHLIQLGVKVDPIGAKRTRTKEITWTTRSD